MKYFLTVLVCAGCIAVCASSTGFSQDSYLNAVENSHQTDFGDNAGYQYNPPPTDNYLPPPISSPPPLYGPPPAPVYGPPPPVYYGPAEPVPYNSHDSWFFEKLKSKLSLFTIGKIVLKLLIFKKIVKFIGIICLLLVLPKLKHLFKDDMSIDDGMESKHVPTDKDKLESEIDELYEFVTNSINSIEKWTE